VLESRERSPEEKLGLAVVLRWAQDLVAGLQGKRPVRAFVRDAVWPETPAGLFWIEGAAGLNLRVVQDFRNRVVREKIRRLPPGAPRKHFLKDLQQALSRLPRIHLRRNLPLELEGTRS